MKIPHSFIACRAVSASLRFGLILAVCALSSLAHAQSTFLDEDFEASSAIPTGWTQNQTTGTATWTIRNGGVNSVPAAAHSGSRNACLSDATTTEDKTQLISPAFDTTGHINITLKFWHAQTVWFSDQDELKVFYSTNGGTNWTQLAHYTNNIASWTERSLSIPAASANTRVMFEGNAKYGYGACLDDVQVTGIADNLSEISVSATDADASEVGPDAGTWTITRSGNTTGAITVNFTLSGNATVGDDYSIDTTSPLSFADGETTKVVTLTPVDDAVGSEGEEVATLTVGAGAGYIVGTASDDIGIYDDEGYDVNILVLGSTRDSGERHNSSVWWNAQKPAFTPTSEPFLPTEIGTQLQSILEQDNRGSINVQVQDRYMSQAGIIGSWTAYSYNLMTWFNYPFPADAEQARWADLRGEGGTEWDYIVLIGDPYTMEYTPGMYALGVSKIAEEVAKGPAELVLLMPWQHANSNSSVNHYKEVVYRAGRSGGHKVAPAALAWEDCGSPVGASHPNTAGAYIAASSIYSSIYNQSAAASAYAPNDANANTTFNTYTTENASSSHYSGLYSFQSPYLMLDNKEREIHFSETGTSTEQGFKGKIKSAMTRSMVSHNDGSYNDKYDTDDPGSEALGWPTGNPMPIGFNYGRDGFSSELVKSYKINPAYWQAGFGYYYQQNTWPETVAAASDIHIGLMQMHDNDLANRMLNEAPTARNMPVRTMWAQIHKLYPTLRPQRDGSGPHLSYELDEAVGTFIYTMYSGRCPLDPEPATEDIIWNCRRIGYETAWMLSRCSSRAPGFKVTPSASNKKTIAAGTTETMSVVFIFPPEDDVTVTVGCSSATAAIVGPKTLTFTPSNYNVPQQVTVAAIPGVSTSDDFNVTYATSSNDEAYDSLSDSWAYTTTRSSTSVTQVDNGTTPVTAYQNTPLTINLNAAGSNAGNTIVLGAAYGSFAWVSDGVIEYTPDNGFLGADSISFAATVGSTQTIGCFNISVEVPSGQVNATAGDAAAAEAGTDTGTFVINRVGDTNGTLDVLFTMGGAATFGDDYTLSHSSPVTIADGEASVTITLTPVDDAIFGEGYESAVLTITPDAAYPIGTASAIVTITDDDNTAPVTDAGADQSAFIDASAVWLPTDVSPEIWLDASDSDSITLNSTTVSQWDDKSGNNNHAYQETAGSQPTYDGPNNKLTFDGGDIFKVTNDPFNGLQNFAVISLQRWSTTASWANASASFHGESSNGWQLRQRSSDFTRLTFTRRGSGGDDDPVPSTTTNDSDHIAVGMRKNSQDLVMRHNGNQTYSATNDTGSIAYTGTNRSAIGGRYQADSWGSPAGQLRGDLKELIVIENATDEDVEKAEGYIAHKWGLEGSLPSGHPYKVAAPGAPGVSVILNGSVTDPEETPTGTWIKLSGPGTVVFSDANDLNATATFGEAGTYVLQLTGDDGYAQTTDTVTITINPPLPTIYATWASGTFTHAFNDIDPANNGDSDNKGNMMEFAFGTDPTISDGGSLAMDGSVNGEPMAAESAPDTMELYFVRRDDHGSSGSVSYTVQFSTDLGSFTDSVVTPTFVADSSADSDYEVVKVPFPVDARFGRIEVDFVP